METRVLRSGLTQFAEKECDPKNPKPIVEALINSEWVCIDRQPDYAKD